VTHADVGRPITVGVVDQQHAALAFAAEEARLARCDLRLAHAYTVPPSPPRAMSTAYGLDIEASFEQAARDVLDAAVALVTGECDDLTVHTVLRRGSPAAVLAEESTSSRLMVLGQDDATPWYSRLFRSRVARAAVHQASCPVVVVPDDWSVKNATRGVTVLLDSRTVAHGPLRYAFEQAARHRDVLRVLHVQEADDPHDDDIPWHDMRRLVDSWRGTYPHVWVDTKVVAGVADLATIEPFERTGVLVLGRPHDDRVTVPLHDSLARAVIVRAGCPVAVVPADYDV
jgi:nucleotide-binding universal stress UspA family protein